MSTFAYITGNETTQGEEVHDPQQGIDGGNGDGCARVGRRPYEISGFPDVRSALLPVAATIRVPAANARRIGTSCCWSFWLTFALSDMETIWHL